MARLSLGHLAQDRSVALVHAPRDQLVYGSSENLATPRLQETVPCLPEQRLIALDWPWHAKSQRTLPL